MKAGITKKIDENCIILSIKGGLTVDTCDELMSEAREYFELEDTPVILDFSKLDFIDSTGVGTLVHIRNRFKNKNAIVLSCVPNRIKATLAILGITDIIKIYSNNAEAVIELRG